MADVSVGVSELLASGVEVRWPEAVALVQGLGRTLSSDVRACRLLPTGEIAPPSGDSGTGAPGGPASAPDVASLAKLLTELLPSPSSPIAGPRVPAALRYSLIRALGGTAAPPFHSVEEFCETLSRFEQGDRRALRQAVYARWVEWRVSPPAGPPAASDETGWASQRLDGWLEAPEPAGEALLREPTPELPRQHVAVASPTPPPAGGRPTRSEHRQAGRFLTTLVVIAILMAATMVAAAALVTVDPERYAALAEKLRPGLEWVDRIIPSGGASPEPGTGDATSGAEPGADTGSEGGERAGTDAASTDAASTGTTGTGTASTEPAGTETVTAGTGAPAAPASPNAEAGSAGIAAPAVPPVEAGPPSTLPGQLVVALDVGQRPVFSPSFASDGTAIFFNQDDEAGGSALKEARTRGDNVLHVLSVLDDGARNYHPQLSPDGAMVAFDSDRDGVRGVYLSDRDGGNIRRVSGEGYAAVPRWAPDGRQLSIVKAEPANARVWNVWLVDVATGQARRLTSHSVGQPWGASWFPDGRHVCYSHEDRLIVLDIITGASRVYPSPRKGTLVRTPAVSPDGRHAVFQLYRRGAWLLDFEDGSMRQVLDDPTAEEFAWSPDGSRVAFHSRRSKRWGLWIVGTP